jgi:hypothetical protein
LHKVLLQAKNGDELYCEEKFGAANGTAQNMHSRCLDFFSSELGVGGGGGEQFSIFSLVPMCCHYIPFNFPMGSHQILIMFPKFPMCSSTCFPQHLSLSHMFWHIFLQMTIGQNSRTMKKGPPHSNLPKNHVKM